MNMYSSFSYDEIDYNVLRYGVEFNGYVNNKKVILCQHHPFLYSDGIGISKFVIIEFEKDLKEILIDTDDSEAYGLGADSNSISWVEIINKDSNLKLWGSYVNRINPNEIIGVYHCVWNNTYASEFIKYKV